MGSAKGNFSAAVWVVGKVVMNVEAVKPNGRLPTNNATPRTLARGNHRTRCDTSNSARLSRHNSTNPHHHLHYRCFGCLHTRANRLRRRAKVRNTTRHLRRRCLQELPELYTTAHLAIPDDSPGNPLQRLQANHSKLLRNHPMGLSTDIPPDSHRTHHQG